MDPHGRSLVVALPPNHQQQNHSPSKNQRNLRFRLDSRNIRANIGIVNNIHRRADECGHYRNTQLDSDPPGNRAGT